MAIILTIANQKGGVGKTTTSVNLAAALAQRGQRTLLVDLDPQGNATMGSGIDKRRLTRSIYHVMIGLSDVTETRQSCEVGGYSLLPANRELAGAEIELVEFEERETRLKEALDAVADQYDFILIDSPPSLSLLTLNGLCAANGVIIPMQCEYYALEGLTDLVNTIRNVHANFNTNIRIIGILRVMYDSRITLAQQVSSQLEEHFKDKVFKTIIPRNIRLAEAPSHGMAGVNFDPSSRGAQGYLDFAAELIERVPSFRPPVQPSATGSGAAAATSPKTVPDARPRAAVTQTDPSLRPLSSPVAPTSVSTHISDPPLVSSGSRGSQSGTTGTERAVGTATPVPTVAETANPSPRTQPAEDAASRRAEDAAPPSPSSKPALTYATYSVTSRYATPALTPVGAGFAAPAIATLTPTTSTHTTPPTTTPSATAQPETPSQPPQMRETLPSARVGDSDVSRTHPRPADADESATPGERPIAQTPEGTST